jgi:CheY-like chemotaxis protein
VVSDDRSVRSARQRAPAAALVDIRMPTIDGYEPQLRDLASEPADRGALGLQPPIATAASPPASCSAS